MSIETVLWRRLDTPGHDICRLAEEPAGWRLNGVAIFQHEEGPGQLNYAVSCDSDWVARESHVRGFVGMRAVDLFVRRNPSGTWELNGASAPGVRDCIDLDLGFTPATNLLTVRRLALNVGQGTEVTAAWLDATRGSLEVLVQRYERRAALTYWYEAPRFGYAAELTVTSSGFVRMYPGLWESELAREG